MEFSFSEEQQALRELAAKILSAHANDETLRGFVGAGDGIDRDLWRQLGAASLIGLTLPEDLGGAGLGMLDLCIVLEEQGRCLAPVPLLQTVLLGAWPLARFMDTAYARPILAGVASGECLLTAALCEPGGFDIRRPRTTARQDGGALVLDGVKESVPHAHVADWIVVNAQSSEGLVVAIVDPRAAGIGLERQQTVNYEPHCRMRLAGARVPAERVIGPQTASQMLDWLEQRALVGLAALQIGVCEEALRRTAAYATERVQFGRPIGSFQGVSLRAADAYMAVEAMRSTMWQAAWRLDRNLPAEVECRIAKWWAAKGGQEVVHTTQHLHGGIGADVDYPIHRFFLWAKQIGMTLGGEARQLQGLAGLECETRIEECAK